MGRCSRLPALGALAVVGLLPGCTWVSRGQLTASQTQNRALAEQNRAMLAEIENLKAHQRTVQNQLIQAEEELADLDQQAGGKSPSAAARSGQPRGGAHLEELSRRYRWLEFDRHTHVGRFDTDVLFDSGQAELKSDGARVLDDLAELLKSPEAAELRVMIVGHTDSRQVAKRPTREKHPDNWHLSTARALAVAEYLERAGVREEQLGVAGYGRHQAVAAPGEREERSKDRRVEIFVMGPDTPVVGWAETPKRY